MWEDEDTLDRVLRLSNDMSSLHGGTSKQVYAQVKGSQTQSRLLVTIEPREKFSFKRGIVIGVSRGIQWWNRGNPFKYKVTNIATTPIFIFKEVSLDTVYSVNNFDIPQIHSLLKPLAQSCAGDKRSTLSVLERHADSHESTQQDNLDEVNVGQLSPLERKGLMEGLKYYADVFSANPKAVVAFRGPPMSLGVRTPTAPRTSPPYSLYSRAEQDDSG